MHHDENHKEEKDVPCPSCHTWFYSVRQMNGHRKGLHLHAFACEDPKCTKTFPTMQRMEGHQWVKHKILKRPLVGCDKCEYKHPLQGDVARHKLYKGH